MLFVILSIVSVNSFAQSKAYLKEEADDFFKTGRYWDAFFLYRDIAKIPEFQSDYTIDAQVKNSSKAMFHWKKTQDYRAYQRFDVAKTHMQELLAINPYDPNRGLLPVLTMEMANRAKRRAIASQTSEGAATLLAEAISLYNLSLNEGIKDDMVFSFIRQCENALEKNPYASKIKRNTTYDVKYEKDKEARAIEILENNNQ